MESYNKKIAGNSKVELVHFTYDESDEDALKWAKKEKFPWPTILKSKQKATDLEKFAGDYVPEYILVDKDGKVIANGKEECFAEIAQLGESPA